MSQYVFYISVSAILVFVFILIYVIILCRKYWQHRKRNDLSDPSDVRVTLTSNISSEELCFAPPSSPYQQRSLYNLPLHQNVTKLESDDQPLISRKDGTIEKKMYQCVSSNQRTNDTDNLNALDTPPKLTYKQPSLEKLLSSLDKSTLSLHWNNESDCHHDNSADKLEVSSFIAPNTTPEGWKATKQDSGIFGVSLKSALVKLQESNEENKNTSSMSLSNANENPFTLKGLKDLHPNSRSKSASFSSKINSSNHSVYKSTTSLYYTDAKSDFDNSSTNSS